VTSCYYNSRPFLILALILFTTSIKMIALVLSMKN